MFKLSGQFKLSNKDLKEHQDCSGKIVQLSLSIAWPRQELHYVSCSWKENINGVAFSHSAGESGR